MIVTGVVAALIAARANPAMASGGSMFNALPPDTTGDGPRSVAIGDLNGDGKPDLVTANFFSNSVSVLLGVGDGTFAPRVDYPAGDYPFFATIGDLKADGKADIVATNFYDATVSVLFGNGSGTFGTVNTLHAGGTPYSVAIGNIGFDGVPDIVAADNTNNRVSVFIGYQTGAFYEPPGDYACGGPPACIIAPLIDGDDYSDVVTANITTNSVSVLISNDDRSLRTHRDFGTGASPWCVAAADLNGDGKSDLVTANSASDSVSVLLGNGDGTFGPKHDFATGADPRSVTIADLNGDGKADLATANYSDSSVSVLLGNGDGTFGPKNDYLVGRWANSVVIGDVNGDHLPDIVVANYGASSVTVLINNGSKTPTLLSLFEGDWTPDGIELRWSFGETGRFSSVRVERADHASGPWSPVDGERRLDDGTDTMLDRSAETGRDHWYRLIARDGDGGIETLGPLAIDSAPVSGFDRISVGPSPCRGRPRIVFSLPREAPVRLRVLDAQGRSVATLAEGMFSAGSHEVTWSADDGAGHVRAGLMFLSYEVAGTRSVRRLVVAP
jgi:hypothetical protein